jgi:glycosyltransferase involved in cell wall biosynthesis
MVKPINIGLLMHASASWMGGAVYIQNLVKAISFLSTDERVKINLHLITTPTTNPNFYQNLLPLVDVHHKLDFINEKFMNKIKNQVSKIFPPFCKWLTPAAAIESLIQSIDFFYPVVRNREFLWDGSSIWAAWMPDFQHKHLPHLFKKSELRYRDALFNRMANHATNIVFSSQVALNDFQEFYPLATAQPFILNFHTVPEQLWFEGDPKTVQNKYHLPDSFFLVSNQFWKYKNHQIIIESLHILQKYSLFPVIVCTGELNDCRSPSHGKDLLKLIDQFNLHQQFIVLGLISRFDQIQLMRRSLAVIQPSLFEGWSTVVEDARTLNKTILLSDILVHREQNPPYATYFSPYSPEDLAQKIATLLPIVSPGPDFLGEVQTFKQNLQFSQTYAKSFVSKAHKALNKSSTVSKYK